MPATTPSEQSRPHGAPAYYLARPASWWLTAFYQRPGQHPNCRPAAGPAWPVPGGPAAG